MTPVISFKLFFIDKIKLFYHYSLVSGLTQTIIMQQESGSLKTLPAPSYIPLDGRNHLRGVQSRPYRHQYPSNHYNRTKRKRESSSSNGHTTTRSDSPPIQGLPPWADPVYPYTKGIIG